MICEYRQYEEQVVLTDVKIGDIFCMIYLLFHKDKELVYSKPSKEEKNG